MISSFLGILKKKKPQEIFVISIHELGEEMLNFALFHFISFCLTLFSVYPASPHL